MNKLNKLSKLIGNKNNETWHYDRAKNLIVDSKGNVVCKAEDPDDAELIVLSRNSTLDLIEAAETLLVCSIALKLENKSSTSLVRAELALSALGISPKLTTGIPAKVIREQSQSVKEAAKADVHESQPAGVRINKKIF